MNNRFLMESYEGLLNRSDVQLKTELININSGCPIPRTITYYERNDLKVDDRSLSPFKDFIDFNLNR